MALKFTAEERARADRAQILEEPIDKPRRLFFYGSLMDPEVLQTILRLPKPPSMEKGRIVGYKVRMWGIYPTLVPDAGTTVLGTVWVSTKYTDLLSLQRYETSAYKLCECQVILDGHGVDTVVEGLTFCWAGDPQSRDLQDGEFDFERYQKYFKPSVVRRPPHWKQT